LRRNKSQIKTELWKRCRVLETTTVVSEKTDYYVSENKFLVSWPVKA